MKFLDRSQPEFPLVRAADIADSLFGLRGELTAPL